MALTSPEDYMKRKGLSVSPSTSVDLPKGLTSPEDYLHRQNVSKYGSNEQHLASSKAREQAVAQQQQKDIASQKANMNERRFNPPQPAAPQENPLWNQVLNGKGITTALNPQPETPLWKQMLNDTGVTRTWDNVQKSMNLPGDAIRAGAKLLKKAGRAYIDTGIPDKLSKYLPPVNPLLAPIAKTLFKSDIPGVTTGPGADFIRSFADASDFGTSRALDETLGNNQYVAGRDTKAGKAGQVAGIVVPLAGAAYGPAKAIVRFGLNKGVASTIRPVLDAAKVEQLSLPAPRPRGNINQVETPNVINNADTRPTGLPEPSPETVNRVRNMNEAKSEISAIDDQLNALNSKYQQAVNDQYQLLKSSKDSRGGVTQGQLIRDANGDVTGRVGRQSNNPQWYSEFYAQYGHAPTNKELYQLAKKHVDEGYQDSGISIPSWKQENNYDETISALTQAKNTMGQSLHDVGPVVAPAASPTVRVGRKPSILPSSPPKVDLAPPAPAKAVAESRPTKARDILQGIETEVLRRNVPYFWSETELKKYLTDHLGEDAVRQMDYNQQIKQATDLVVKSGTDDNVVRAQLAKEYGYNFDELSKAAAVENANLQASLHEADGTPTNPDTSPSIAPPTPVSAMREAQSGPAVQAMAKPKHNYAIEKEGDVYRAKTNDELSFVTAKVIGDELYVLNAFTHDSARQQGRYSQLLNGISEQAIEDHPNIKYVTGTVTGDEALQARKRYPSSVINKDPHSDGFEVRTDIADIVQKKTPDIQAMASTANGRPLLPRGAGTGTDLVKRSEIIADLAKKLDIPIRVARFRQKAHGIFKVKPEVVRSKLANDLPVIAHEVGHALDKQFGLANSQFDSELLALGKATSGPKYTKDMIRSEGIAEFIRQYLTEPANLQKVAPNFLAHFEGKIPDDVLKVLTGAQEQIQKYIDQPATLKSISELSINRKEKRKLPSLNDLYTKFVEEINPIKIATNHLGVKGEELFNHFWLLRGVTGRAQAFLKHGVPDSQFAKVGKAFDEILSPVKKNLDEFRAYIKDKRALELDKRGIMTGSDLTPDERLANINQWERDHPEFIAAHQEIKQYQDSLLKELIDSGFLSPEDVAQFKALNQEYVPFFRVYESEAGAGAVKGGRTNIGQGVADLSSPIKRIKGSDREIIDPLESIIKNTYQYIAIAERNKALRKFVDASIKEDGLGGLVEKIPTPMQGQKFTLEDLRSTLEHQGVDTGNIDMETVVNIFRPTNTIPGRDNVITVFNGGKREFYQLDPDLYRAVTAADADQMGAIVKALNFPVRILRAGVVNTLEFWLKNMFRDQFSALVNSKNGYIPWVDMFRGMAHVLNKSDAFGKFMASGAAQGLRTSMDRKYLQTDLRNILARSSKDKAMNIIKNPLEAMRMLSEMSELGTRVGDFAKGIKKDPSAQGIRTAAVGARDLIDFARAGTVGKNINKVSAFWNAQVQGLDKTIRTFTNPKTAPKAFAKSLALISVPTAALYEANKNDPRYQELQQWDKDVFWHFWVGDHHFRLPIPFELGVVFKVLPERILSMVDGKEDQPFREFGKTAWENISPIPKPLEFVTGIAPMVQAYANESSFGSPIVPRREENLLPEDQAGPYTSNVAKMIAKIPGLSNNYLTEKMLGSPRKVDYLIQGYAGSLGKYGTQLVDAAMRIGGSKQPPKPDTGTEEWPVLKAFQAKTLGGSSESVDRYYETLDRLTREKASAAKNQTLFGNAAKLKYLQTIQNDMKDVSAEIRRIQDDYEMTGKEKAQQLRELNLYITNLARMGIGKDRLQLKDLYPSMK